MVFLCEESLFLAVGHRLLLFTARVSHFEAVCGDALVCPVREVSASRNYRKGKDSELVRLPVVGGPI